MTTITITFLEEFNHGGSLTFEVGTTIQAEWLGGGDVIRIKYQHEITEIPTSVISYTVEKIER